MKTVGLEGMHDVYEYFNEPWQLLKHFGDEFTSYETEEKNEIKTCGRAKRSKHLQEP